MQYRGRIKHSYPAFIISDENNSNTSLADAPRRNIYVDVEHEQRVNFQLPDNRRSSICHQNAQLTLRERIKGSPRFPHRILPTSSLNALEDGQKASTSFHNGSGKFIIQFDNRGRQGGGVLMLCAVCCQQPRC